MKGDYNIMLFIEDMDRLLSEIKTDIRFIKRYIVNMEQDKQCIDTYSLELIIQNLSDNVNDLFVLTMY